MTAVAIAPTTTPRQHVTPNVPPHNVSPVRALTLLLDTWSLYVEQAHPRLRPTSHVVQEWVNELIGIDSSREGRLCQDLDGDFHWWCENTARGRALVVGLTGRRALVRPADANDWVVRDQACRRCNEIILFPRRGWEAPYCSRVCATGRVSDRLVERWLEVLNDGWEKRIGHARREVIEKGEGTWEEWCARQDRTRNGVYDIRFEHPDVMYLRGLDFAATQRQLEEYSGSEHDVVVLIDRTELRQSAFDSWRAIRPGDRDG